MVDGLSTPQIRVENEWTGVVTASDPIERPLRLPRRRTDSPTSRVRNTVTATLMTNIKRSGEHTSGASRKADPSLGRLVNFDQPIMNRRLATQPSAEDRNHP